MTAKRDASVITRMSDELNEEEQDQEENLAYLGGLVPYLHFQGLFPAAMQQEYNGKKGFKDGKSQDSTEMKLKWFKYLSNQACNTHWGKATEPLRPSAYLGLEISKDQLELLNPSIGDLMLSKMEEDTIGAKAKKKIARRRHDFIDGSAKSYAKILNCPTRMRRLEDYNKMQACLAEVLAGREEEKKQRKLEKEQEKANKEKKKAERAAALEAERKEKIDGIVEDIQKGQNHFQTLKMNRLKEILRLYFYVRPVDMYRLKKASLLELLTEKYLSMEQEAAAAGPTEE